MRRRRWPIVLVFLVTMLAGLGLGAVWLTQPPGFLGAPFADHRTQVAERITVLLSDLTEADMAPGSALSKHLDAHIRRVTVHYGEVHFTVKRDRNRVFVVNAGSGDITAVGTVFNLKIAGEAVHVAVEEGSVDVAAAGRTMRVTAGQEIRYGPGGIEPPRGLGGRRAAPWRKNRIDYRNATLADMMRDIERYRPGRIVILDDKVAALPLNEQVNTRRVGEALEATAEKFPVELVYVTDYLVFVLAKE